MAKVGKYAVTVSKDDGTSETFLPGTDMPKKYADKVDNPYAFADADGDEPESTIVEIAPSGPPPQSGKGSSEPAWRDYAFRLGVSVDSDDSRDDIITKVERAGFNV